LNAKVNSIFEEVAFVLMYSHPQLLTSIVIVEVFSTDEHLAKDATGHNPAVLEAEGREEVLNKARNVFMGFHIAVFGKIQLTPRSLLVARYENFHELPRGKHGCL
jgi:hypothetical protein